MKQFKIVCRSCEHSEITQQIYGSCRRCGGHWLDAFYVDVEQDWRKQVQSHGTSMWRYAGLLPIADTKNIVTMGEGWTPLMPAFNLGLMLGHEHIYIKDERQGPTGSFKDRQASVAVSVMKEAGVKEAVVASTGNVAIAYSAYCARAGIKLWAFVPSSVPAEKMREVALYGTEVIKVTGTYDQTKQVAVEFAQNKGLYLDKGVKSIAAKEAMKTVAYEISEQLEGVRCRENAGNKNWNAPDWYIQAVSGGMGPIGVMKGFRELHAMGAIPKVPQLACIQVSGCAPMADAFKANLKKPHNIITPHTDILALATGFPGDAYTALRELISEHGGLIDCVTDAEAFRAVHALAKIEGISVEPATAVAFAGLINLVRNGTIQPHETVVINCSGHTFPVEKHILGEYLGKDMDLSENGYLPMGREEGLLTALEQLDNRVKRIAIIEDNPDASRLIRRILQAQGEFLIEEAKDGIDGLALIQKTQPHLIILDLMMPRMDGFTIIEKMKQDSKLSEIPIIVVTAKELTMVEQRRLNGKIDRLLQKGSFLDTDLVEDIRNILV
jgi:threonine synthase